MPKGNGGLGSNPKNAKDNDLIDNTFFGAEKTEKVEKKYKNKLFKIEESTLKKVKLYGIEYGMKEWEVINLALANLFEAEEKNKYCKYCSPSLILDSTSSQIIDFI